MISIPATGPEAFDTSRMLHEAFDKIGSVCGTRKRSDRVLPAVVVELKDRMDCDAIKLMRKLANKFVAHAADQRSRKDVIPSGIRLNELEYAQKMLVTVAHDIEIRLLWGSARSFIASSQYDQLEGLDRPFAKPDELKRLPGFWNELCKSRRTWTSGP